MKSTIFLLSLLSVVSIHASLPHGTNQIGDYRYTENEYDPLPLDWQPYSQPAPESPGIMSYFPSFLCVALLGYIGYDYVYNQVPQEASAPTPRVSPRLERTDHFSPSYDYVTSSASQTMVELSVWEHVTSSAWNAVTIKNIGYAACLLLIGYLLNACRLTWQNPQAKQAPLYQDITHYYYHSCDLHKRVCAMAKEYIRRGILTEKEAYAIVTHITDISEQMRQYYLAASSVACHLGGYKKEISEADIAVLPIGSIKPSNVLQKL